MTSAERGALDTLGNYLPPMFIFPSKRIQDSVGTVIFISFSQDFRNSFHTNVNTDPILNQYLPVFPKFQTTDQKDERRTLCGYFLLSLEHILA